MHVGSDRALAERIVEHLVRAPDEAPTVSVRMIVDRTPADSSRLEVVGRPCDRLGNQAGQSLHIVAIRRAAQSAHRRGSRMSMSCGNEDPVGAYSGHFLGEHLGAVDQIARHHAAINDHERQASCPVVQHEALGADGIVDFAGLSLQKPAVDENGECCRRNIDVRCPGSK